MVLGYKRLQEAITVGLFTFHSSLFTLQHLWQLEQLCAVAALDKYAAPGGTAG